MLRIFKIFTNFKSRYKFFSYEKTPLGRWGLKNNNLKYYDHCFRSCKNISK